MRVFALGTGGFIPTAERETSSFLLSDPGHGLGILFDAGTGVKNLLASRVQRECQDITRLHVVLSHLHLDHIGGLTWLLRLWPRELVIHVPTHPLVEIDGVAAIGAYSKPPFFSLPFESWPHGVTIEAIDEASLEIEGEEVNVVQQRHKGGSVGFRFRNFAYITDTDPGEGHLAFLKGVDVLIVDAMHDSSDYTTAAKQTGFADHGSAEGTARLAKEAGVKRMGMVHLDPLYDERRRRRHLAEARRVLRGAFVPRDGEMLDI